MSAAYDTASAVRVGLFIGDFGERVAAALDAGDLMEVGRLVKDAADKAKKAQADDADPRYRPTAKGLAALSDDAFIDALLPRLAIVPVR